MWYKVRVTEDGVLEVDLSPVLGLCDFLLDESELFLKFTELRPVFRLIIPTFHHNFRNLLWTVLWS